MNESRTPAEAHPERMERLARLPVFLALSGKRAVLAGGGAAAAWKAELLSAAGAHVEVFAEAPSEELAHVIAMPPHGGVVLHRRAWSEADLPGSAVAIGSFEEDEAGAAFAAAARAAGVPVNVIDRPQHSDFSFGAIVNRSPLVIGISTDGAAPVFAQAIRARLEAMLPKGFAQWAEAARRWRTDLKRSGLSFAGRRRFWQLFTAHAVVHPNDSPMRGDFDRWVDDVRELGGTVEKGSVALVGAGPGDPELLTLKAVRTLQSADVILFDDLVSRDVLDFARREARKLLVGKTGYGPSCRQEDINALMVGLAQRGKRVVRLKGGDPLIFARASEEIAACADAGIVVTVVPGITAAQGAASRLALPLTGRGQVRRLQYITGHARDGRMPDDIDWSSLVDPSTTTAVYMPTRTLETLVETAIQQGLDPDTPVVAISRATRPDESIITDSVCRLPSRLRETPLPGPLLVMIGSAFAMPMQVERQRRHER